MQEKKLLIIGKVWPEPNSSAAGRRMIQLIKLFQDHEYIVHFASTSGLTGNEVNFTKSNIRTHAIKLNDDSFDPFLDKIDPDVVMYDRFMTEEQFGWRVRSGKPEVLTILDTEDLHFLRKGRQEAVKKRGEFDGADYYNETTKRELASILRTDLTLIISSYEMDLLTEQFQIPSAKLCYLPIIEKKAEKIIPFEERTDVVFIGNFMHEPNWDAVLQLKKLWKEWTDKPKDLHLKIYGAYPSHKAFQLNSEREQFHVVGKAESSSEVIGNAKMLLAPLRFGAGLKGKLIESMSLGTPSVTTSVGIEGLANRDDWGGVVEDRIENWTGSIKDLFNEKKVWITAQEKGFENLLRLCDYMLLEELMNRVAVVQNSLVQHRNANFIGEILHYHTLRSNEYMSRWISEKNKQ